MTDSEIRQKAFEEMTIDQLSKLLELKKEQELILNEPSYTHPRVFLVHEEGIIYGCFNTRKKAVEYANGSAFLRIKELEVG